jgi:hypothetical protein
MNTDLHRDLELRTAALTHDSQASAQETTDPTVASWLDHYDVGLTA